MIQIKFLGGAKKSFQSDSLTLYESDISLKDLLSLILQKQPSSTPTLDIKNILIAINGTDSSALQGRSTILKNNDTVSIIPVIHGGSQKYVRFTVLRKQIHVIRVPGKRSYNVDFLDSIRKKFPRLRLQAVSDKFVLDLYHLEKIISLSIHYEKNNMLLSNRLETDILMRFAISGQISDAIKTAGIRPGQDFFLIAIGNATHLDKLTNVVPFKTPVCPKDNSLFLKRHFHLTRKQLNSVHSNTPLADILIEKASILFG